MLEALFSNTSSLLKIHLSSVTVAYVICPLCLAAGVESSSGIMDENGEMLELRQRSGSFPIALMALPMKPQSTWTLEPEYAQNIRGSQVNTFWAMQLIRDKH